MIWKATVSWLVHINKHVNYKILTIILRSLTSTSLWKFYNINKYQIYYKEV